MPTISEQSLWLLDCGGEHAESVVDRTHHLADDLRHNYKYNKYKITHTLHQLSVTCFHGSQVKISSISHGLSVTCCQVSQVKISLISHEAQLRVLWNWYFASVPCGTVLKIVASYNNLGLFKIFVKTFPINTSGSCIHGRKHKETLNYFKGLYILRKILCLIFHFWYNFSMVILFYLDCHLMNLCLIVAWARISHAKQEVLVVVDYYLLCISSKQHQGCLKPQVSCVGCWSITMPPRLFY